MSCFVQDHTAIFGKTTQKTELLNLSKAQNSSFFFFNIAWLLPLTGQYQESFKQTHTSIFQTVNSLLLIKMEKSEGIDKNHSRTIQKVNLIDWSLLHY